MRAFVFESENICHRQIMPFESPRPIMGRGRL